MEFRLIREHNWPGSDQVFGINQISGFREAEPLKDRPNYKLSL
jgi:hypothetical protein